MRILKRKDMTVKLDTSEDTIDMKFYLLGGLSITLNMSPEQAKWMASELEKRADALLSKKNCVKA